MKAKLLLTVAVVSFLSLPLHVSGQTAFNYASAHEGAGRKYDHSLIRAINDTSTLVYYYDESANQGYIARLGLALTLQKAMLPHGCTVNDMRITGDNVYFCGHDNNNAVIGHIRLSDFDASNRTITLYSVDTTYVTHLNRMVAYESAGKQKVVMVGDRIYTNFSPFPWDCPYHYTYFDSSINDYYEFYYYNCLSTIILEVSFNGPALLDKKYVVTGSPTHLEIITEVIETPRYVAFVGYYTNHHTTIVHRCDKGDVVTDFLGGWHWCYAGLDEGNSDYHGCWMNGDTIAVSSLSKYEESPGNQLFSTNIRVFDLSTMKNTHAQGVPLFSRAEPYDFMYMPKVHQFVLLQNVNLPTYSEKCAFLHIEPYTTSLPNYYAKGWFESRFGKSFYSLSRPMDSVYVAAGGEYWCLKDFVLEPGGDCYKVDSVKVAIIPTVKEVKERDSYYSPTCNIDLIGSFTTFENRYIFPACYYMVPSVNNLPRINKK